MHNWNSVNIWYKNSSNKYYKGYEYVQELRYPTNFLFVVIQNAIQAAQINEAVSYHFCINDRLNTKFLSAPGTDFLNNNRCFLPMKQELLIYFSERIIRTLQLHTNLLTNFISSSLDTSLIGTFILDKTSNDTPKQLYMYVPIKSKTTSMRVLNYK